MSKYSRPGMKSEFTKEQLTALIQKHLANARDIPEDALATATLMRKNKTELISMAMYASDRAFKDKNRISGKTKT
jgi:hypothetical protein